VDTPSEIGNSRLPKKKIFNDPIYGLVNFPFEFLYELIDHPYVQRLRRIKQLGLTDYVYSGGSHSRFNHCLGALHLMTQAIQTLRWKGVEITDREAEAVSMAILLHDVGHGPFSHALENLLLPFHHEHLSIRVMEMLNTQYGGRLDLAIQIFRRQYKKPFLHQLVASQLDMDRMDYLNRDSFYSGVVEGMIGYDRIIKMMNVVDGHLVIEEKGALSVEQFLMARRMMYWQVYLHKTVLAAEKMLQQLVRLIHRDGVDRFRSDLSESLLYFFDHYQALQPLTEIPDDVLLRFLDLDDTDVIQALKSMVRHQGGAVQLLARGILDRHIFKIILKNEPVSRDLLHSIRLKMERNAAFEPDELDDLIIEGTESSELYNRHSDEIRLLLKTGELLPFAELPNVLVNASVTVKHFVIFPRLAD
jgi:HD superfamily phosphohydrolase